MLDHLVATGPPRSAPSVSARSSARRLGMWLAAGGWLSMTAMWVTGSAGRFGHDQADAPGLVAAVLFLAGWTVMVAGMMLPSTLPTLGRLDRDAGYQGGGPGFMVGYFTAWAAFGAVLFVADGILHRAVDAMPWLAERPSLILGATAMFAGGAELLGRRSPPSFPAVSRAAGASGIGGAHAVDRMRRCWPLMFFAMAVGMSSPVWMLGLTLVMGLELRPHAGPALRFAGLVVLGFGAGILVQPRLMPVLFGSG